MNQRLRGRCWPLLTAVLLGTSWFAQPARAQSAQVESADAEGVDAESEPSSAPGRFATVFVYGRSEGTPGGGKWFTLASIYTLSAASLAFAGVEFAEYMQQQTRTRDFLKEHPGPCFDLSSSVCEDYSKLLRNEHKSWTYASASLAGFGVFLLSGVVTAQVWDNVPSADDAASASWLPQVQLSPDTAYLGVAGSF